MQASVPGKLGPIINPKITIFFRIVQEEEYDKNDIQCIENFTSPDNNYFMTTRMVIVKAYLKAKILQYKKYAQYVRFVIQT